MNIRTPEITDLPALQSLWQEAFGDTETFIQLFFDVAFDYRRCFCAVDNGFLTAALYWFDCKYQGKPIAYLYAIATSKDYQQQGICHKLMEHTHNHLRNAGYAGAVLVPGNTALFDFYRNMGYEACCFIKEFHCTTSKTDLATKHALMHTTTVPDDVCTDIVTEMPQIQRLTSAALPLHPATKGEYATLRRRLLPSDGILQENTCLDFLEAQAQLFAGEDFIMAAHTENNKLFVAELLGNTPPLQQILHALHCKEGLFRTPGTEKPFAMYLSLLDSNLPNPSYFGLAFD